MRYKDIIIESGQPEYDRNFWNYLRGNEFAASKMGNGRTIDTGSYALPSLADGKYEKAVVRESILRRIGSVFANYDGPSTIWAADAEDRAEFVPEMGEVRIHDVDGDFTQLPVDRNKLAIMLRLPTTFISDAAFDLEEYLIKRLAKAFARAEDDAFISGTGTDEPVGLLHDTDGAETGAATTELSFVAVIDHYFSVKPEYRKNGIWLMNDETALALKKLKDDAGNYLWRGSDDTILGKPVLISEFMPGAEAGAKPILFGDFSYYWIVKRSPVTVKTLKELFALNWQTGYLAFEFIDGKLIRREAVKALQITSA